LALYQGGSLTISDADARAHDRLVGKAFALIRPEILIDGEPRTSRPGLLARWRLNRGINNLEKAIRINPSWQNHYFIGKALQRLGDLRKAMEYFGEASRLDPTQTHVAREAGLVALALGESNIALALLRPAAVSHPHDAALQHDLGLAYLLAGSPRKAEDSLRAALALQPHEATARLLMFTSDVIQGKRSSPNSLEEIQRLAIDRTALS
jgi:tetratricopeptide (TPR) repeat protein